MLRARSIHAAQLRLRSSPSSSPGVPSSARGQRERNMRSPHTIKHHPAYKGDRVQFNLKVATRLKDQFAATCKQQGVNQTDALEQALAFWIKSRGKRDAKQL